MKIKKLLSLISAAAISASCFVGMAVSASAADTTVYNVTDDTAFWSEGNIIYDDNNVTVKVTKNVSSAETSDSNFKVDPAEGITYNYNIPLRNNSDGSTDILVIPKVDGKLTAYVGINSGKTMYIKEDDPNGTLITSVTPETKGIHPISANLETEKTYMLYAAGTSAAFMGLTFEPAEVDESAATTLTDVESQQFAVADGYDVDLTAAKLYIDVTGTVKGIDVTYGDTTRTADVALTGGSVVIGAIVSGLIEVTNDTFGVAPAPATAVE